MRLPSSSLLLLLVSALVPSCRSGGGGGGGSVDVDQFPSAAEVAAIAARAPPPPAARAASAVNSWAFVGPFDDTFGDVAVDAVTDVERPWAAAVGKDRLTRAGRCSARELAHFLVERGVDSWPDQRWLRHMSARCGSADVARPVGARSVTGIGSATDKELITSLQANLAEDAAALGDAVDVGVAFARKGDLAVAVSVELQPLVRLQPTSMKAVGGSIDIKGSLVVGADAELVFASVNQGDTGFARCDSDRGVALPAFAFKCPVDVGDAVAGIDMAVSRRGRFLANGLGGIVVLPGAAVPPVWSASVWGAPAPLPEDDAGIARVFLDRANGVRNAAGLPPLVVAEKQSATAARLAPHYFGERHAGVSDQIALGMLAGWDLTSPVRDGDFGSFSLVGESLDEVLGAALDSPGSRSVLMNKDAGIVALGAVRGEAGIGMLVTTWEPFIVVAPLVTQNRVFEALKAERARRGLGGLGEVGLEDEYAAGSARLQKGEEARTVLQDLLDTTVASLNRSFRGWFLDTSDPEHIAWPDELLTAKPTYIAVSAGMRQRKNSPWAATTVVIVAFVDTQGSTVAMR